MNEQTPTIHLDIRMTTAINFALQQNKLPIIREIVVINDTDADIANAALRIWSDPAATSIVEQSIALIPAHASLSLKGIPVTADASFLAGLTERMDGHMHLTLSAGEAELVHEKRDIAILAFDQWHGSQICPELLTSFITPNHPEVIKTVFRAAELLQQWSGDPSFDAYQTQDANRVRLQAAAIYGAMQAQNIVYAVPPASFEAIGQRIRLCGDVIQQKMGTCLDLTLFYAACLESVGLHPLLLLQRGHIFAGVWLENVTFPEAVQDDAALVTKRLTDGINEIAVVECTALVSGKNISFEAASAAAIQHLNNPKHFEHIIDVSRARLSGVRPLPLRIHNEQGWQIITEERDEKDLTAAPSVLGAKIIIGHGTPAAPSEGRLALWERKLLDLSLRNTLINMRLSQTVIPILSQSLSDLEDALSNGKEYGISPRPAELDIPDERQRQFEGYANLDPYKALLKAEFQNKRLRSSLNDYELSRAIVHLHRAAKLSLEENGANTLYLALGMLRWYETGSSQRARYAPIVLLPVEIVRKSALKGHVVRLRDEDPQMNITLLEMLSKDFGISIGGLDPLPADEHGIDIRTVFAVIRQAVMGQNRWDVIESACLGTFSFSQFVMWNDVRNRSDDLRRNPIVQSLIDGKLAWEAPSMIPGETVSEDGALLPIPVDASQLFAIEEAAKGSSFVLHGPPGTGKSQTITALISNALAQGKRVLFVAEKMAALSVVQRRLENIGIGAFCLELHSNKLKKRDVLEQLRIASEIAKAAPAEDYTARAERAAALRAALDGYAKALHETRPSGLSLFEMVNGYEPCRDASDAVRFPADFAATVHEAMPAQQKLLAERTIAAARAVSHPANHPLARVRQAEYTQHMRTGLAEHVHAYRATLDASAAAGQHLVQALSLPHPKTARDWAKLAAISAELAIWTDMPRAWAQQEPFTAAMNDIRKMAKHLQAAYTLRQSLCKSFSADLLRLDGAALLTQWQTASAKWFLPKALEQGTVIKQMKPHVLPSASKAVYGTMLPVLADYRREQAAGETLLAQYSDAMGRLVHDDLTDADWSHIEQLAANALASGNALRELTDGDDLRKAYAAQRDTFESIAAMNQTYAEQAARKAPLYALLNIADAPAEADFIAEEITLCNNLTAHAAQLKEWTLWRMVAQEACGCGLAPFIAAYENGLAHDEATDAYGKGFYTALIGHTIDGNPALSRFSGALFNETISQFRKLNTELTHLAQTETFCRLAARVPNFAQEASHGSEVGILQRAIRSNGRGISIRRLFEQIPNLLPRLCPCMLMSPISAAQYLDPKHTPFDIVVFDEASQVPTHKAVGALARGTSAVIVGDPKQMPPTSFFSGNSTDEDNLDSEDLESILDDCLALNLPQSHLIWHYRSRHESLIAFSNSRFYENRLCTFPSANNRESKVSLVRANGFFDRGGTRQNRAEAEMIVQELIRRCYDPASSGQSVGVVTFNIPQQNLIDDLLTEAFKADPQLEAWAAESAEPLFIKNLENVQGDERDAILFSVGYGPDADGKVTMNFGPLNREGGWRRLNVAVSRARCEMIVFSTLGAEQIDLARTSAEGVAALKAFLEYAGGANLPETVDALHAKTAAKAAVAESLCKALAAHGYAAEPMVGSSAYRVDIGVVDPRKPGQYLLGILLDGASYQSAKTTHDRELSQIGVLQRLGWNLHRIWTVDWWDDRKKELCKLLTALDECKSAPQEAPPLPSAAETVRPAPLAAAMTGPIPAPVVCETASDTPTYRAADLPPTPMSSDVFVSPQSTRAIQSLIRQILEAEAPICESLLTRRLMQCAGITRAGARLQARVVAMLAAMRITKTDSNTQAVYWHESQDPQTYNGFRATGTDMHKRDAKDIPSVEIANAIAAVLEQQIGLPRADLVRETAAVLGYARAGAQVAAAISDGLAHAEAQGRVVVDENDYVTLPM